jgi:TonB-linked SusC/RagA family outer membrane protein
MMKIPIFRQACAPGWKKTLLVMRLSAILLLLSLHVSAGTYSQDKVTLNARNAALSKVLKSIEKQTSFRFVYSNEIVPTTESVSINVKEAHINEVLDKLLATLSLQYRIVDRKFIVITNQGLLATGGKFEERIKGRVVNRTTGAPVHGASVQIKGTDKGMLTREDGTFELVVDNLDATIVISFVGFGSVEVKAADIVRSNEISMAPNLNTLDDVVVVGYGTQKARNITGAMGRIGSREIKQVAVVGLDQALQGRIAGVQVTENSAEPGADVSIRIRGVASITRGSEPLVVVDGIPMSVKLSSINPSDIETIDVLKDAASAAIYGSRGSAGVILVTTKRGKTGKVRVSLDAYTARQMVARKIPLLNGPQFAKLANENLVRGGFAPNPEWMNPETVRNTDWQDEMFRTAPMSNYNIAISGGSEKSRNYLSFGYTGQEGVVSKNASFKRFTGRFNSDYDLSNKLKVGVNVNFSTDQKSGIRTQNDNTGTIISTLQALPTDPVFTDIEGPFGDHYYGFEGYSFSRLQNQFYAGMGNNPVYVANKHIFSKGRSTQMLANAFGELELIKGLKLKSLIGYTLDNGVGKNGTNAVATPATGGGGGITNRTNINSSFSQSTQWNWVNTLSYARSFGKHNISSVIGSDALEFKGSSLQAAGSGAPGNQNSISASRDLTGRPAGHEYIPYSLVSYFARVMYDFDDRYLLSGVFRRDGSSRFSPQNRWGDFPSISAAWRISKEKFMESVSVVDELKIRGSYGSVGNQNIPDLQFFNQYSNSGGNYAYTFGGNLMAGLRPTVLGTEDIHWERNIERNLGFDATFMKGKLTFSADIYKKELKDLLGDVPVPQYAAPFSGSVIKNTFSMENRGIELNLGLNPRLGDVNFSFNANFSTLENKVTSLVPGNNKSYVFQNISLISEMKATTRSQVGERIGNFWGFVTDGIIQNAAEATAYKAMGFPQAEPGDRKYKDLNKDGRINDDDRTIIGNGLPGYLYGLNARVEYKGFDINAFFNGQGDAHVANMAKYFTSTINFRNPGLVNGSTDILKAWNGEGSTNKYPRNSYTALKANSWFSDTYIEDGSFFRLRNLQIGYTFPSRMMSKIGASSARVYVAAQNLFTITNYTGYDPEVGHNTGTGGGLRIAGVDYGRYPMARMFTVGFTSQF